MQVRQRQKELSLGEQTYYTSNIYIFFQIDIDSSVTSWCDRQRCIQEKRLASQKPNHCIEQGTFDFMYGKKCKDNFSHLSEGLAKIQSQPLGVGEALRENSSELFRRFFQKIQKFMLNFKSNRICTFCIRINVNINELYP